MRHKLLLAKASRRLLAVALALSFAAAPPAWAGEGGTLGSSDQAVRSSSLVPSAPPNPGLGTPPLTVVPSASPASPALPAETVTTTTEPISATPPVPQLSYQRRYNLTILGASLLVATWGADRLLTQDLSGPVTWLPWLPLVGPWYLLYSQTQVAAPSQLTMSFLVIDGLLQAGGLTMGILGFVLHKKRMVMSLPHATQPAP